MHVADEPPATTDDSDNIACAWLRSIDVKSGTVAPVT